MSQHIYYPGDMATVAATFRNGVDDTLIDPSVLRFLHKGPGDDDWTSATYLVGAVITRASLGVFRANIALTRAGVWRWRWEADGATQGVEEGRILVTASGRG